MQGKRYAAFSRFSVHTARVTHLIKIFTFYREYAILCTKETRKSSFKNLKGGTYGNLPACLADYKYQSKPYKRASCARKHTVCAAVYIPARCKARPVARCHGRPAQRGVSRRRGMRAALADAFARRPRRQRFTFALRERDRLFRAQRSARPGGQRQPKRRFSR